MNKNRILELLTDKDVLIFYDGKQVERYSNRVLMVADNDQEFANLEVYPWFQVDFDKFTFFKKFDATIK